MDTVTTLPFRSLAIGSTWEYKKDDSTGGQYLVKTFVFSDNTELHTFLHETASTGTKLQHDAEFGISQPYSHWFPEGGHTAVGLSIELKLYTKDEGNLVTGLDVMMSCIIDRIYQLTIKK